MMPKFLLLFFCSTFISSYLSAQIDKEPLPTQDGRLIEVNKSNSLFGKVVDLQNNKGISGARFNCLLQKAIRFQINLRIH